MCSRHEIVGIVQEIGAQVDRFKVGDHVGVGFYVNSCHNCDFCNNDREFYCSNGSVITFNSVDVDGTVTKGGFSNFIVVHQGFAPCLCNHLVMLIIAVEFAVLAYS